MIRSVTGDIDTIDGRILAHEHLQVDLCAGKDAQVVLGKQDQEDVIHDLAEAMHHGLRGIVDLSVVGSGRDLPALAEMSRRLGLPIICATGFYWDPHSALVAQTSVEALRDTMIREVTEGVDGTGIRCGVIKIGTSSHDCTDAEERIFHAAGLASIATGAPVFTHTSEPTQALWHLEQLERAGADLTHVMIGHLGAAPDDSLLVEVARRGAFIGIDKIGLRHRTPNAQLARLVKSACDKGLEKQIILSSDIARKDRLQRYGGHSYSTVFIEFVPLLKELGITEAQLSVFLETNPQRLLHFFQ